MIKIFLWYLLYVVIGFILLIIFSYIEKKSRFWFCIEYYFTINIKELMGLCFLSLSIWPFPLLYLLLELYGDKEIFKMKINKENETT